VDVRSNITIPFTAIGQVAVQINLFPIQTTSNTSQPPTIFYSFFNRPNIRKQQAMEPLQPTLRSESLPRCPICLECRSSDTALLLPCNHAFNVECISVLLRTLGQPSRQCQLCRTKLEEVRYAFTQEGDYATHRPGKGDERYSPFLRNDEIVPPGDDVEGLRRRLELRRLRMLEDYDPAPWTVNWMSVPAQEGDTIVLVSRTVALKLAQEGGVHTNSQLIRTLSLTTYNPYDPETLPFPLPDPSDFRRKEIAKAREEIKNCLEGLGVSRAFEELHITEPEYEVPCDERGLYAIVTRSVAVKRVVGQEATTTQETLAMREKFLLELPTIEEREEDPVLGIGRVEREKAVKMTRQEIQGVVETLPRLVQLRNFRGLDRGSTGILDAVGEGEAECLYCEEKHRNGECRLPWVQEE